MAKKRRLLAVGSGIGIELVELTVDLGTKVEGLFPTRAASGGRRPRCRNRRNHRGGWSRKGREKLPSAVTRRAQKRIEWSIDGGDGLGERSTHCSCGD